MTSPSTLHIPKPLHEQGRGKRSKTFISVPLTCVQSRTWNESGTGRGTGIVNGKGSASWTMAPGAHGDPGLGGSHLLVGSWTWSGSETSLWTPSGPWAWTWSRRETESGTGRGVNARGGVGARAVARAVGVCACS